MPFRSKAQSNACFATGGFGGKVDCKEFAGHTDYKHLPKRKKKVKGFKEWLEENHSEFLDEAWYDPSTWGQGLKNLGTAAAITASTFGAGAGMPSTAQAAPPMVAPAAAQKPDISKATDKRVDKDEKLGQVTAYWLEVDNKNTWVYVDANNDYWLKKRGNFSPVVYSKWLNDKGKWSNWLSNPARLK
jgi:hypothetical protein